MMPSRLALLLVCLLAFAFPAEAAKRVALVIGNANYSSFSVLANPHNDAKAVAEALKQSKFDEVMLVHDLDRVGLNRAMQKFSGISAGADIAVIYYAGHGVEVDGINYLVPTDATLTLSTDVAFEAISLDLARTAVAPAAKLRMVILDACRNNPFKLSGANGNRATSRGLRAVEAAASEFIAYSAKEGTTAQDGPPDGNSPFAKALVDAIQQPGLDVRLMFGKVRDDVVKATNREQEPFTYASLGGDAVYLNAPIEKPVIVEPVMLAINLAWLEVKSSQSKAVLEGFKHQYKDDPNFATFGPLAEERLQTLSTPPPAPIAKVEIAPPPPPIAKPIQLAAVQPEFIIPEPEKRSDTQPAIEVPIVEETEGPSPELLTNLQKELFRIGCYRGNVDGKWGRKATAGVEQFNALIDEKLDSLEPSEALLENLKAADDKSCIEEVEEIAKPTVKAKSAIVKAKPPRKIKLRKPIIRTVAKPKAKTVVPKRAIAKLPAAPIKRVTPPAATKPKPAKTAAKPVGKKNCRLIFAVVAVVRKCT